MNYKEIVKEACPCILASHYHVKRSGLARLIGVLNLKSVVVILQLACFLNSDSNSCSGQIETPRYRISNYAVLLLL